MKNVATSSDHFIMCLWKRRRQALGDAIPYDTRMVRISGNSLTHSERDLKDLHRVFSSDMHGDGNLTSLTPSWNDSTSSGALRKSSMSSGDATTTIQRFRCATLNTLFENLE